MTKEELFYIQILKDHLHGSKTNPVDELNWQSLNELALSQNTNGIVFYQCKEFIPKEYYQRFNSLYMSEIYNYGLRVSYTNEIIKEFNKSNISYFMVKGPELAKYYPIPALRTMGDVDIEVKEEQTKKAYSVVEELGYELYDGGYEMIFGKNNIEIEIHHKLLYVEEANRKEEVEFFLDMFDHVNNNELDPSYHFIFLIVHLKKHILRMGCGFRQFMDLAVLSSHEKLNWNYINNSLEKMNLLKFKNVCMALVDKWFDYKFEDILEELDNEFYQSTTFSIIKNGAHGYNNEENDMNLFVLSKNKNKNRNEFWQKLSYMAMRYFPSYENLKNSTTYSFVNNRPYLLPMAWIYRFYLSIKQNKAGKEILKSIKNISTSKEETNKRLDKLNKWGL